VHLRQRRVRLAGPSRGSNPTIPGPTSSLTSPGPRSWTGDACGFQFYRSGVYNADCGSKSEGHCLAVVGYSDDYWILRKCAARPRRAEPRAGTREAHLPRVHRRTLPMTPPEYAVRALGSSWGSLWGQHGYMYFKRGANLCNIGTRGAQIANAKPLPTVEELPRGLVGGWSRVL
jgi:hypothetical protein